MGFIIVIAVLALSAWAVFSTVRRLRQTNAGRPWGIAFFLLLALGCGVGAWFAFGFQSQVSPQMRLSSFPVPLVFFQLEKGTWVDFVTPPHVMYPGLVANISSFAAVALLPLIVASRFWCRGGSR